MNPLGRFEDGSEHRWTPEGLPVVRRSLTYGELLSDIRDGKVKDIVRWDSIESHTGGPDMRCLVVYLDRSVAKCKAPSDLQLLNEAMKQHNVRRVNVAMDPTRVQQSKREKKVQVLIEEEGTGVAAGLLSRLQASATQVVSVVATTLTGTVLFGVIGWLKYQETTRGDFGDRMKIRIMEQREKMTRKWRLTSSAADRKKLEDYDKLVARAAEGDQEAIKALEEGGEDGAAQPAAEKKDPNAPDIEDFLNMTTVNFVPADVGDVEERKRADREARRREMAEAEDDYREKGILSRIGLPSGPREAPKLKDTRRIYFDDVAGIGRAKDQLEEIVDFFRKPEMYFETGSRRPRGVLMAGPPGTGKTLMAKAVAGEAGVSFFSCNASEFVEVYVGTGSARVRDLFKQAKANEPAVVFIDELDALGRERTNDPKQQERNQTLNQLLVSMDGIGERVDVVIIAATNRPDILDQALVRPGRFDRKITVGAPDDRGRAEILGVHLRERPCAEDIDVEFIANSTVGYTGAKLANLVNQAALEAARSNKDRLTMADLEKALDFSKVGRVLDAQPRADRLRRLAVRLSAQSVVTQCLSIGRNTRLMSLEARELQPNGKIEVEYEDNIFNAFVFKKRDYKEAMVSAFAGHVAEEVFFGYNDITNLNVMDLERARELARNVVYFAAIGAAPSIRNRSILFYSRPREGPIAYENFRMPQDVKDDAEEEVMELLREARERCRAIVARNRECISALCEELLIAKQMRGYEIFEIFKQKAAPEDLEANAGVVVERELRVDR